VLAVLASRLLVVVTAAVTAAAFKGTASSSAPRGRIVPGISHPFGGGWLAGWLDPIFTPLVRWDALWYQKISLGGYVPTGLPGNSGSTTAFFPLYPLLVHTLGGWAGNGATLVVATLLSLATFAIGLAIVHRLATLELGPQAGRAAVLVIAFWPAGPFFSAPYTESLFLALSAGTFLAARRDRWWLAALLAGLASATRNTGVLLIVPLAIIYFYGPRPLPADRVRPPGRRGRWAPRFSVRRDIFWFALVPTGLIAFSVYLQFKLSNWQAWRTSQKTFGRPRITSPITTLRLAFTDAWNAVHSGLGNLGAPSLVDLGALGILLVSLVGIARRLPFAYLAWVVVAMAPAFFSPYENEALRSLPRFLSVMFPIAMWIGYELVRRQLLMPVIALSAVLLVGTTAAFTLWYPFV
jgi:Mannosyltransferase (PIG-V)